MTARALALVAFTAGVARADLLLPPQDGPRLRAADPTPPRPARRPALPRPAPEITKVGAELAGTWTCKGTLLAAGGASTASAPSTATVTTKVALDAGWIQSTSVQTVEDHTSRFAEYRTYDGIAKQWTRIVLTSQGAHTVATSLGDDQGVWTWTTSPTTRDFEKRGKNTVELWGEAKQGGAWQKLYAISCSK